MRKVLKKVHDIFSWLFMFAMAIILVFTLINVSNAAKTGENVFLFGYRPVFVLSGSMEPYMMTHSICLTKEVTDINELEVGDVITFHVGEGTEKINVTHRIISIENGYINTKGDNNYVTDDLFLTMENVDAEVICVFNEVAWLFEKWETTSGKIMIISFALAIVTAYFVLRNLVLMYFEKKDAQKKGIQSEENKDVNDDLTAEGETGVSSPEVPTVQQASPEQEHT